MCDAAPVRVAEGSYVQLIDDCVLVPEKIMVRLGSCFRRHRAAELDPGLSATLQFSSPARIVGQPLLANSSRIEWQTCGIGEPAEIRKVHSAGNSPWGRQNGWFSSRLSARSLGQQPLRRDLFRIGSPLERFREVHMRKAVL